MGESNVILFAHELGTSVSGEYETVGIEIHPSCKIQ